MPGRWLSTFPTGDSANRPGVRQIINVPNPNAGAEWTYTFTQGYYWRLIVGQYTFVTAVAAANRFPGIKLTDGNVNLFTVNSQVAVTASLTVTLSLASIGLNAPTNLTTNDLQIGIPELWFEPGYTIGSNTPAIQGADQYSNINIWYECLDFGAYGEREKVHKFTYSEAERFLEHGQPSVHTPEEHPPVGPRG